MPENTVYDVLLKNEGSHHSNTLNLRYETNNTGLHCTIAKKHLNALSKLLLL